MTPTQAKVLDVVRERLEAELSPSFDEISRACGVTRPTTTAVINKLVEDGYLRRLPRRHRSLALADRPDLRAVASEQLAAELARRGKTLDAIGGYRRLTMARGVATCAADCCQVPVRRGHLFCRDHWFKLPHALRERILDAFGAKDAESYEHAVTEARDRIDGTFAHRVERD